MHSIRVDAKQHQEYAHEKWYAGASIDCFIKDQTVENALYTAQGWIAKNGWEVLAIEEQREISKQDFEDEPEGLEYFHQALTDEEVFVYYVFESEDGGSATAADVPPNN